MTEWGEWDLCNDACGLGMRRRKCLIKMPSSRGIIYKAEIAEVEKCMIPE